MKGKKTVRGQKLKGKSKPKQQFEAIDKKQRHNAEGKR
jgi:hypothetical protein